MDRVERILVGMTCRIYHERLELERFPTVIDLRHSVSVYIGERCDLSLVCLFKSVGFSVEPESILTGTFNVRRTDILEDKLEIRDSVYFSLRGHPELVGEVYGLFRAAGRSKYPREAKEWVSSFTASSSSISTPMAWGAFFAGLVQSNLDELKYYLDGGAPEDVLLDANALSPAISKAGSTGDVAALEYLMKNELNRFSVGFILATLALSLGNSPFATSVLKWIVENHPTWLTYDFLYRLVHYCKEKYIVEIYGYLVEKNIISFECSGNHGTLPMRIDPVSAFTPVQSAPTFSALYHLIEPRVFVSFPTTPLVKTAMMKVYAFDIVEEMHEKHNALKPFTGPNLVEFNVVLIRNHRFDFAKKLIEERKTCLPLLRKNYKAVWTEILRGYCTETEWSVQRDSQHLTPLTFLDFLDSVGVKVVKPFKIASSDIGLGEPYWKEETFVELIRRCLRQKVNVDHQIVTGVGL